MSRIGSVNGHMNQRAHPVALVTLASVLRHQLVIAHTHGFAVNHGTDTPSGQLFHFGNPGSVRFPVTGFPQRAGNGMVGIAFRQRRHFQQLFGGGVPGMNRCYMEYPPGQSTGFVKYHRFGMGQRFQIVAALDQNALAGSAANSAEEAEGHGNDQRTGTGNYQENQGAVDPVTPISHKQGRNHCQQYSGDHHHRSIPSGKAGDEGFIPGFPGAGILHQLQNSCHCRLTVFTGHPDAQQSALIDTAADDLVSRRNCPGQGFARQRCRIQRGGSVRYNTVQRNALSGLDGDDLPHLHLFRADLHQLSLPLDIGPVGTDIHQRRDGTAGTIHGEVLKQLSYLIQQHDQHALRVFPDTESTHCGQPHQEVFIEHLSPQNIPDSAPENIPAHYRIGNQERHQPPDSFQRCNHGSRHQHGGNDNSEYDPFFFLFHVVPLLSPLGFTK